MTAARFLCLLLAALCCSAGCRRKQESELPPGTRVGLVLPDGASPFHQAVQRWAGELAREKGFELQVQDARGKASEQVRAVEQLLAENPSVLIVSPLQAEALRPVLKKAATRKVYLVMLEETAPDADVSTVVEFDQELAGRLAADYVRHRLPSGARVAVIGSEDAPGEPQRLAAFREAARRGAAPVEIVSEEAEPGEAAQRAAVDRVLGQSPPDVVFALTDRIGLAAAEAIRRRRDGRRGGSEPFVISYGGHPAAIEEMRRDDSPLAMVLGVFPQHLGERAARLAFRIAANKPTPTHVFLPVLPVTRQNSGSYPAWTEVPPASLAVPWPSEVEIKQRRED